MAILTLRLRDQSTTTVYLRGTEVELYRAVAQLYCTIGTTHTGLNPNSINTLMAKAYADTWGFHAVTLYRVIVTGSIYDPIPVPRRAPTDPHVHIYQTHPGVFRFDVESRTPGRYVPYALLTLEPAEMQPGNAELKTMSEFWAERGSANVSF